MLVAQRLKWVKKLDTNLYELRSKVYQTSKELSISMWSMEGMSLPMDLLKTRKHQ